MAKDSNPKGSDSGDELPLPPKDRFTTETRLELKPMGGDSSSKNFARNKETFPVPDVPTDEDSK